jgi:hypothetical protein
MFWFKNSLIASLALLALALLAPAPAHGQEKVFVANPTSEPVPTVAQGTTTVAGSVRINNTASAPALVRDVDRAASTHVGRKASEIVNLGGLFDGSGEIFFLRSLPDGTATAFSIPAGKVFVVTDINWQMASGNPGTVVRLALNVKNVANPALLRKVFNATVTLNAGGVAGVNESLGSGFVVSSAAKITVDLTAPTGALEGLLLRGYLAPDE